MSKKIPTLQVLIGAIHKHYGFAVALMPAAPEAQPGLAERVAAKGIEDSAAPYGRKLDGSPKARPGRKQGSKNAKPATPPAKTPGAFSLDLSDLGCQDPAPPATVPETAGDVLSDLANELGLDAL